MFLLDRLLIGGLGFVFDKLAVAVDRELNDEDRLREELLAAEMQLELGEISDEEFKSVEQAVVARLREIREERGGQPAMGLDVKVTGVEATFGGDEE